MNLNELSTKVDLYIKSHGGYWDIPWLLASIIEELGELSKALQLFSGLREKKKEQTLINVVNEESGDLFFALICLTNYLGINLETALLNTLNKYAKR